MRMLVAGSSGSGKSTLLRGTVLGIAGYSARSGRKTSQIILDHKGDFSDLPGRLGPDWLHLNWFDGLRLGLNAPAGISPHVWTNKLATIVAARANLVASASCLAAIIRFCLATMNPGPPPPTRWPDFRLLLEVLPRDTAESVGQQSRLRPDPDPGPWKAWLVPRETWC